MTFEDFDKWQADLWEECVKIRDTKGKEYAHSQDRFANFNRLAEELEISNIKIGWIFLRKHLDSIASYVKCGKVHSTESIRGRIVDAIVYLTLIGGMIAETEDNNIASTPHIFKACVDDVVCSLCKQDVNNPIHMLPKAGWKQQMEDPWRSCARY